MKKLLLVLLLLIVGCSDKLESEFKETSLGVYAETFDQISSFSQVYEMSKNNVDTVYIQAGLDEYTETHLLETMPHVYSTTVKAINKYNMNAYALLDSKHWLTNSDQALNEIKNVLDYNSNFNSDKLKGVNINIETTSATEADLQKYIYNLKKARELIDVHNNKTKDNFSLSISLTRDNVESLVKEVVNEVDKIIFTGKLDSIIEDGEKILSMMDEYNKDVEVIVSSELFNKGKIEMLNVINDCLSTFNEYDSFNGFVIDNYLHYSEFVQEKRP